MNCLHNHDQILEFLRKIFLKDFQIYQNYLCALTMFSFHLGKIIMNLSKFQIWCEWFPPPPPKKKWVRCERVQQHFAKGVFSRKCKQFLKDVNVEKNGKVQHSYLRHQKFTKHALGFVQKHHQLFAGCWKR